MKTLALFVLGLTLANANPHDAESAKILSSAHTDIEAANNSWFPALKEHNAAAIADVYADSGVFVSPDGKSIQGRTEIKKMYEERLKKPGKYIDGKVIQDGTSVADGRIYEWGHAWVEFADESGKHSKRGGPYLTVWEKGKNGHWVIVRNLAL